MYIGLDVGGTNLKSGVLDDNGKLIFSYAQATRAQKGLDYVLNILKRSIYILLEKFPEVKAIGIGIPGIVDETGTIKISPNLPEWYDVPLGKFVRNIFSIPSIVDNDANVAAIAEMELGVGKDLQNFIYLTLGTGAGGAIVINREVYKGENLGAGEIGHLIIDMYDETEKKELYRNGILEKYVGRNQITELGYELIANYPDSLLHKYDRPDPYFISEAISLGDKAAEELFTIVGHRMGIGLASAMNFLDIGVVIVGGGISQAHPLLLNSALKTIQARALPTIAQRAEIRKARYTKDAGIIGAALLAKSLIKS